MAKSSDEVDHGFGRRLPEEWPGKTSRDDGKIIGGLFVWRLPSARNSSCPDSAAVGNFSNGKGKFPSGCVSGELFGIIKDKTWLFKDWRRKLTTI